MSTPTSERSPIREITIRGIILGGIITLIFTAANVYLGLKVGLTFATSIPAAVISMAVLRYFKGHTIVENNIVQTIASSAGTLSAIIFVLPGLVMVGWWTGFPYWITLLVCALGGILGVMYSIPLRRTLVTGSDLPYPEGVAAAEVLKVGDTERGAQENRGGLRLIVLGGLASAGYALLAGLKVVAGSVTTAFKVGAGGTMIGASMSMALIGIGHLVGISVGIAMIVGLLIAYGVLLPVQTSGELGGIPLEDGVNSIFANDVRFIGAGAIAIAAIWTLVKMLAPIARGIKDAATSARKRRAGSSVEITERDIPINIVGGVIVVSLIPIGFLLWDFVAGSALQGHSGGIVATALIFIFVIGLLVASVCGYMAGLIGSSNSPISGVGILVALLAALLLKLTFGDMSNGELTGLVAFTIFTSAVVFGVATISNDNLQDLKTGQLVGATPWKQQVALIIGVVFGSLIIPPILDLMMTAFGFQGAPGAGPDALAAPQAALISSLVNGVFGGSIDWGLIGLGAAIGAVVIIIDEVLGKTSKFRLPPLAVGMGMYLPISLTLIIPIGAFLGHFYDKWASNSGGNAERKKRMGVLVATGLIVGESLFGVIFAGIVAATGNDSPLAIVGDGFTGWAVGLGIALFVVLTLGLYQRTRKIASQEPASTGNP
ncbi:OPT family oligopeptide transporter [Cumulibacter soli]|uniref:OPT family oligopeptide transporter n=1 Tax=Cumulibacter soli TaxID=2546344 RepID=UPI001FB8D4FB|nr:oligopeptide transporter, OPT family [Cumulibacter soli]